MKLTVTQKAKAELPVRDEQARRSGPVGNSEVVFDVTIPDGIPDQHISAFYMLLNREAERIAQICAVAKRDEQVNRLEAERIRQAPKDRPSIIVAAGTKDPEAVQVLKGTYEVSGRRLTAPVPRGNGDVR